VRPASSARLAASEDGAETAASSGRPASTAFCTSSNDARPLTSSAQPLSGSRSCSSAHPTILSTALCLPTSSRTAISSPEPVNSPAACSPPVREKTRWASRSRSGSDARTDGANRVASEPTAACGVAQMSSTLVLPQTPHALVVMKLRRAPGRTSMPGASETSAMFPGPSWSPWPQEVPSQSLISKISAGERTTASLTRNPAASSMSSPGVRMVMVSAVPSTRMPSGSSAASKSARAVTPPARPSPGTVIRTTRRLAVRPGT
jgi:hypothetical protein